jgi:hypothetical protein
MGFGHYSLWLLLAASLTAADFSQFATVTLDHPAIDYSGPVNDPVSRLAQQIANGSVKLSFATQGGYLRSLLDALKIPVESQVLVFSKTSVMAPAIQPRNPRAIYFNDSVAVATVHGTGLLELAAQDPRQGTIFYLLNDFETARPIPARQDEECLNCHVTHSSMGVAGMIVRSVVPSPTGQPIRGLDDFDVDHRTPFEQRWGGWYVTGKSASLKHMGNAMALDPEKSIVSDGPFSVQSLEGRLRAADYLLPSSDLAPLMVLDHQMHLMNLFTRFGWEIRAALWDRKEIPGTLLEDGAKEIADYMLFVDEAPLAAPLESGGGYARAFLALGPKDSRGRSLRELDLRARTMKYPLSYMIYSEAFDGMPQQARDAVYRRLWAVLSGAVRGVQYDRLTAADRRAVVEIVRETKKGLPDYWR